MGLGILLSTLGQRIAGRLLDAHIQARYPADSVAEKLADKRERLTYLTEFRHQLAEERRPLRADTESLNALAAGPAGLASYRGRRRRRAGRRGRRRAAKEA
ncbi:MAG: hypothetical protein HY575_09635 [candidate division NC10 bacterium]|nr:hypothetical protein [candidate division NC10 bacterium]